MKKKKTEEEVVEVVETQIESVTESANEEANSKENANCEIPAHVDKILKIYKNYESLYVTEKGCVYAPDTELSESTPAILYKNPYYNS